MRRLIIIFCSVTVLGCGVALFLFMKQQPKVFDEMSGSTMGGKWEVRLGRPAEPKVGFALKAQIQAILDRIDGEMSTWKSTSDLSRFNSQKTTDWVAVPAELTALVQQAQQISEKTGGAFDITVGPLVNLWGFGPHTSKGHQRTVPAEADIAQARKHVGYPLLEVRLSPPALRKLDPDVQVDLSAIAQGFASDQVAAHLDAAGITDYLVDCGEIRARGNSPKGQAWRVGIQNPTPDTLRTLGGLQLTNQSMATSGDYRNFFEQDGRRYSHEIDPRTGRPIDSKLGAVSVVHSSAAHADAMATALMVLGPDEGFALAEREGLAALFIIRGDRQFEFKPTKAFPPILHGSGDSLAVSASRPAAATTRAGDPR